MNAWDNPNYFLRIQKIYLAGELHRKTDQGNALPPLRGRIKVGVLTPPPSGGRGLLLFSSFGVPLPDDTLHEL